MFKKGKKRQEKDRIEQKRKEKEGDTKKNKIKELTALYKTSLDKFSLLVLFEAN